MNEVTSETSIIYKGLAQIYLQGKNALQVLSTHIGNEMHYVLGNEQTNLIVHDFRQSTTGEALSEIWQCFPNEFAHQFNQNAFIEVSYTASSNCLEIDLYDTDNSSEDLPLLWMGILEDNLMPGYRVKWEIFKPIDSCNTAFVAFIAPAISLSPTSALQA